MRGSTSHCTVDNTTTVTAIVPRQRLSVLVDVTCNVEVHQLNDSSHELEVPSPQHRLSHASQHGVFKVALQR